MIVGTGSLYNEIREKVKESSYSNNFDILGNIPHNEIMQLHKIIDILFCVCKSTIICWRFYIVIISKDAKGSATNYEIIVEAQFNIKFEDKVKVVNVNEKENIKKISDMFEQRNYENTLKKNFAISIANKLNL